MSIHVGVFFLGYLNAKAQQRDYVALRGADLDDPRVASVLWPAPTQLRSLLQLNGLALTAKSGVGIDPWHTIGGRLTPHEEATLRRIVKEWQEIEAPWMSPEDRRP